jgi:NitT/TauT family transport system permease protein
MSDTTSAKPSLATKVSKRNIVSSDVSFTDRWISALLPFIFVVLLLAEHTLLENRQPFFQKPYFSWIIEAFAVIFAVAAIGVNKFPTFRSRFILKSPLFTAFIVFLIIWDLVTLKLALLPLPYFPSPAAVTAALINEWETLGISALYSLRLLLIGYGLGALIGLPTGVLMGWYPRFHYWVNPILRSIGPIPATAWIPLAMVAFPSSFTASIFLLVLACWFPITVMTWSGIANVNKAYYEVARSLGASEFYLITRVALPAAMPSIFVGSFMSMGVAFVTLIVGEMLGVKAGLGWFITWAQGWAEFSKVYAALIVMSVLFSGIITLLFKVRDKVLVWQKGLIKW